ncbi:stage III sporulation protein AB [Caproicibacter fermentans]|uniref:Stage III sporulation protein AB n=2 Tax=Caproicibacter fermentans TaxID=2576756 RepID=A0A7G8TCC0_9FIRM|nr:stage III sporulation protein AB [Caproicibacter fermentans]QNK41261.1 stage III sporulation protein AB [Caproicibacter fermentans]
MLKLLGALLLIMAGTLWGFMESRKLSVRVESLESFLRFLSAAKTEVRYSAVPVVQVLKRHGTDFRFMRECAKQSDGGKGFAAAWKSAVVCFAKYDGFTARDREMLLSFGEDFGASDTDGQISHLELFSGLFGANLKSAREDRNRKSKLYLMLGIFAGLSSALLLC